MVRANVREQAHVTVAARPLHLHRIDGVALTNSERQNVIDAGLESARGLELLEELLCAAPERHPRADGEPVGAHAFQADLEVAVWRERPSIVAINEGFLVDVVHDEVERAIAVQVAIGGAAREARRVEAPGGARVDERQVPVVAEGIVRQLRRGHRGHEPPEVHPPPARGLHHRLPLRQEGDVVL